MCFRTVMLRPHKVLPDWRGGATGDDGALKPEVAEQIESAGKHLLGFEVAGGNKSKATKPIKQAYRANMDALLAEDNVQTHI